MKYAFKGGPMYQHQRTTFDALVRNRRFAVFSQPGTGKTRSLVCAAEARIKAGVSKRGLYACPLAVMETIGEEFAQWTDLSYTVLSGGSEKRVKTLRGSDTQFYIINYEGLVNIEKQLADLDFDIFIGDESTRIRKPSSQRHKSLHRLTKGVATRWLATGTPMPHSPWDYYGQMRILDPSIFGSEALFRQHYVIYGKVEGHPYPQPVGYKNQDELKARVGGKSIRFLKSECLDLPEKVFVPCKIPLGKVQRQVYMDFADKLIAEMPSGCKVPIRSELSKYLRLQQTTSGFVGNEETCEWLDENVKLTYLRELLDTLQLHDNKVIIWCRYVPSIKMLQKELACHQPAMFYGGEKDQSAEIRRFNTDPKCRILIGNSAVGIGCTMNVAHYVIFYELPYFDPESYEQAQDRNHRIGQTEKVTYYLFMSPGTVDMTIWYNITRKMKLSAYVSGDDVKNIVLGEV